MDKIPEEYKKASSHVEEMLAYVARYSVPPEDIEGRIARRAKNLRLQAYRRLTPLEVAELVVLEKERGTKEHKAAVAEKEKLLSEILLRLYLIHTAYRDFQQFL